MAAAADAARSAPGTPRVLAVAGLVAPGESHLLVRYPPGTPADPAGVRARLRAVPGVTGRVRELAGPAPTRRFPVEVAVCGPDRADLRRWAEAVRDRLAAGGAVEDLRLLGWADGPAATLDVDREKVRALGLELADVFAALTDGTGPAAVVTPPAGPDAEVWLDLGATPADRLTSGTVRAAGGKLVPLAAVVTARPCTEAAEVRRVGTDVAVVVSANPPAGGSPAAAAAAVRAAAELVRQELKLPADHRIVTLVPDR